MPLLSPLVLEQNCQSLPKLQMIVSPEIPTSQHKQPSIRLLTFVCILYSLCVWECWYLCTVTVWRAEDSFQGLSSTFLRQGLSEFLLLCCMHSRLAGWQVSHWVSRFGLSALGMLGLQTYMFVFESRELTNSGCQGCVTSLLPTESSLQVLYCLSRTSIVSRKPTTYVDFFFQKQQDF